MAAGGQEQGAYTFNMLPLTELVDTFNFEFRDARLTVADIKSPQAGRIQGIFVIILRDTLGIQQHQLAKCVPASCLQYPELHNLEVTGLCICLRKLLRMCHIEDFSKLDVIMPQPARTHRFLSAMLNAKLFMKDRQADYQRIVNEKNVKQAKRQQLVSNIQDREKRLIEEEMKQAEDKQRIEKLKQDDEEKAVHGLAVTKELTELQRQCDAEKMLVTDKRDEHASKAETLTTLKQQVEKIDAEIVRSPEKYMQENKRRQTVIADLEEQLRSLKVSSYQSAETKLCEERWVEGLEEELKNLEKLKSIMDGTEQCIKSNRDVKQSIEDKRSELATLDSKYRNLQKQHAAQQENFDKEIAKLQLTIAQMQNDIRHHTSEQAGEDKDVVKLEAMGNKLQADIIDDFNSYRTEMAVMKESYNEMLRKLEEFNKRLFSRFSKSQ